MKKWITALLALFLACTACMACAEENTGALVDRGNEAFNADDYATVLELYTRAADAGNTRAITNLGRMYEYGLGVEQSYEKAIKYYKKLRRWGNRQHQAVVDRRQDFG